MTRAYTECLLINKVNICNNHYYIKYGTNIMIEYYDRINIIHKLYRVGGTTYVYEVQRNQQSRLHTV